MEFVTRVFMEAWVLLLDSAIYVIFGILMAGLMRALVNPESVGRHLGRGRFLSVIKASVIGIPVPLCSCGVLPAAASLKKQGANNGATTAFLISTPESGVDSIALTY
ncbi:MAG: permease, partial [Deltaproteobacteria bacterium]|nr:permease [Deltaproteobacteria bacterium]